MSLSGSSGQSEARIPELDGIRGIAIGMVLVYHYFLLTIAVRPGSALAYLAATGRLAWSGVDLFFVLSGFLIGGILLNARGSANYFKVFYLRRLLRIVPIYLVLLVVARIVVYAAQNSNSAAFAPLGRDELPWSSYLLFIHNFWMAKHDTFGPLGLGVTWSLAIEEQFYLFIPAVIRKLSGRGLLLFVVAGIVAAPITRVLFHILYPSHWFAIFVMMPARADALLLGVLGAIVIRKTACREFLEKHRFWQRAFLFLLLAGAAFLTLKAPGPRSPLMLSLGLTWLGLLYLSFILYALTQPKSIIARAFRIRWLRWLGTIAYGTYLFHSYILLFFRVIFSSGRSDVKSFTDVAVSLLALAVTLVLCRISWVYFEKPAVKLGHRFKYDRQRTLNPVLQPAASPGVVDG